MTAEAPRFAVRWPKGGGELFAFNAFISYSRRDRLAAAGIQKALHRIGRRPGQLHALHALRVFRDSSDPAASPDCGERSAKRSTLRHI